MCDGRELLTLAAGLSRAQTDKMAHALGWPDTLNVGRRRGRGPTKWTHPYRNGWSGSPEDPDWAGAAHIGLAVLSSRGNEIDPYARWAVTPLGMRAVRLRLEAVRFAQILGVSHA